MKRISICLLVALFSLSATADPEQAESGPPEDLDLEAAAAEQAAVAEALYSVFMVQNRPGLTRPGDRVRLSW